MAKKRKTLPKDFADLIEKGELNALKDVFSTCELDAYTGYSKSTALSAYKIPDELVRWLVEQGADIDAADTYKRTAMHAHASSWCGNVGLIISLGGNIEARDYQGDTPLHAAAGAFRTEAVKKLLAHKANINAKNNAGRTPMELMLNFGNNANIANIAEIAEIMLNAGAEITPNMAAAVTRIGKDFEFHRENFNKSSLDAADKGLTRLYELFNVTPVAKRITHDGVSPITVQETNWKAQHQELWTLLVPSQGAAKTVQGEVIRITGKVASEIYRNGGANWGPDFKKMLDALLLHFTSETALNESEIKEASQLVKKLYNGNSDEGIDRLCELAVRWVLNNQTPLPLSKPSYRR